MTIIDKVLLTLTQIRATMGGKTEEQLPVPVQFNRTAPTPYRGRAKFRYRVTPGDTPECFAERAIAPDELVVQLPVAVWDSKLNGHAVAVHLGANSRRVEGIVKPKWG